MTNKTDEEKKSLNKKKKGVILKEALKGIDKNTQDKIRAEIKKNPNTMVNINRLKLGSGKPLFTLRQVQHIKKDS